EQHALHRTAQIGSLHTMALTNPSTSAGTLARARRHYTTEAAAAPSSERLVVLLYERLLRDLDEAAAALANGTPAHESLLHAQDIVSALEAALDPDAWAGANGMASLYDHLHRQLIAANLERDPVKVLH